MRSMPQNRSWLERAADPSTPTTEDNETVRTATYEQDGKFYLVPTIRMGEDGKLYKPEDPLKTALEKGDAIDFTSQEEADRMSKNISEYIGRSRGKEFALGGDVKDVSVDYNTAEAAGETGSTFRGAATFGDEDASIRPSIEYSTNKRQRQFDDGVILNEKGKRIGVALNGEIKLAEGIKLRGGIQKVTSTGGGTAVYKGEVIDDFEARSKELNANVGAQLGKLNIDYEKRKQENNPSSSRFSAGYKIDKDSTISGSVDFPSKRVNVNYNKRYAKGGNVEQMNRLFAEGGMMDDSGESVNGVKVPPGSLREEVADDIPAQLSEGEFVVPADVVRYIGLEKLMAMRDKAKQGLKRMEEMGQMGNADEVENPDQEFGQPDEDFEAEIDDIMAEEGDQSAMPEGFARGGFASGTDLTKAIRNPVVDVRFFRNKEGKVMFITHINNRPLTPVPEGFEETDESYEKLVGTEADKKAAEEEEAKAEEIKRLAALGMSSSSEGQDMPTGATPSIVNPDDRSNLITLDKQGNAEAKKVSKLLTAAVLAIPIVGPAIAKGIEKQNENAKKAADAWNASKASGNVFFDPEQGEAGDWVDMTKAMDRGYGVDIKGMPALSVKSLSPAAKVEREGYLAYDWNDILKEDMQPDLDKEQAQMAEARQNKIEADKKTAEREAKQREAAAKARADFAREEAERNAANYEAASRTSTGDTRSFEGAGTRQTQESLQSTQTGGFYGNRGGLVDKRYKPSPKKKGLAAKKK